MGTRAAAGAWRCSSRRCYTLAAGAIGFGLADVAGGSGFLAVYIVGLFIGNTATPLRRYLVSFHAGLAFLAQVGLFIVLGLFVFPRQLGSVILPGLAVVAVLLFVARPARRLGLDRVPGLRAARARRSSAGPACAAPSRSSSRHTRRRQGCPRARRSSTPCSSSSSRSALDPGTDARAARPSARSLTGRRGSYEPPLEVAAVDSLGSGLLEFGVADDSAVVGRHVRELGLPRDALVAVIVRDGRRCRREGRR